MDSAGSGDADAGVVCHGSLLNDDDVEAIKNPVLFLYSANDQQIPDEKREKFQEILKTKSFPAEGVYYPDQACLVTLRPVFEKHFQHLQHPVMTLHRVSRAQV